MIDGGYEIKEGCDIEECDELACLEILNVSVTSETRSYAYNKLFHYLNNIVTTTSRGSSITVSSGNSTLLKQPH